MLKLVLPLAAVMLLPACSNRSEEAQETLKSHMGDKVNLEFQNLETFTGGAVCGEFRSNDPIRGSRSYRRFIVWGQTAKEQPSRQEWAIFCTQDTAAALQANFGIGPVEDANNHLSQIRSDLKQLQSALQQYREDNSYLPTPTQGLAALVSAATTDPVPMKFRPGGYLDTLAVDPWGRPYVYGNAGLGGGVVQQFQLYTLGADGAYGGEGKNADVKLEHLKYLDYLSPN